MESLTPEILEYFRSHFWSIKSARDYFGHGVDLLRCHEGGITNYDIRSCSIQDILKVLELGISEVEKEWGLGKEE